MSKHPIVHIEISANDRELAGKFYAGLFGWKVQQMPEMNYATFEAEGGPGGGFNPVSANYSAGTVLPYVETEDINRTLELAVKLGGKVLVAKSEIPGISWYAVFSDPTGNMIGLLEPLSKE